MTITKPSSDEQILEILDLQFLLKKMGRYFTLWTIHLSDYLLCLKMSRHLWQHSLKNLTSIKQWRSNVVEKYKAFWAFDGETLFLKNKLVCFKSCHLFSFWWNFVYASSCFEFYCYILRIMQLNFQQLTSYKKARFFL